MYGAGVVLCVDTTCRQKQAAHPHFALSIHPDFVLLPDGFLPRPWETDEKPGPVDGDSTLSRKHGWTSEEFKPIGGDSSPSGQESAEETFPTLVPTSLETLKSFETSEDSDPFDKPTGMRSRPCLTSAHLSLPQNCFFRQTTTTPRNGRHVRSLIAAGHRQ